MNSELYTLPLPPIGELIDIEAFLQEQEDYRTRDGKGYFVREDRYAPTRTVNFRRIDQRPDDATHIIWMDD